MEPKAFYEKTDGSKPEEMSVEYARDLIAKLGIRVGPSYINDDGDEVFEIYGEDETAADYPDGDPYADTIVFSA